ncbi:MAG: acetate/propionate family kinase [Pseudomonadota bacterium]
MKRHILCINSGSSSLKFALYNMGRGEELLAKGAIERIGLKGGICWIDCSGKKRIQKADFKNHNIAIDRMFVELKALRLPVPDAVGHRIVHGGKSYCKPAVVDNKLVKTLNGLIPFAPLHLPSEIVCVESVEKRFPKLKQVACFDTAFHRNMPEVAKRFPLPEYLHKEGVERYGFHGLSYEYIVSCIDVRKYSRVIIAHLGNGASLAAVKSGKSIDTTMGFTPAGGFMMGTRPGDLDPGILIYLINQKGMSGKGIERLINDQSGLLGVSGLSSDMKTLLEKSGKNAKAALAIDMFCYQLKKEIGGFSAALGGVDLLVFTGGIGERAALVRSIVCKGLKYLGIELDEKKNKKHAEVISTNKSSFPVRVIPTNEDLIIARHTHRLIK